MSDWLLFNTNFHDFNQFSSYGENMLHLWWDDHDDDVRFVLDQHAESNFYSASLLKP